MSGAQEAPSGGDVTHLGFGGAPLGNLKTAVTDQTARAAVDRAWDQGIRTFDTAPHYGLGLSEHRLGQALAGRPRDEYTISTKVGRLIEPRDIPLQYDDDGFDVPGDMTRRWDFSLAGVRRSLEESLRRTGLDRIDILYVHDPDQAWEGAAREGLDSLQKLKTEGLVTAIGVGTNSAVGLANLMTDGLLDVLMLAGRHTLLDQGAVESVLAPAAAAGVTVTAVGVFGSGLLATPRPLPGSTFEYREADPAIIDKAVTLARLCEDFGIDLPTAALAFPLRHPAVSRVTVGMRTAVEVDENVTRMTTAIPEDFWAALVEQKHVKAEAVGLG